ncbi:ABC transporter permease [Streptomyces sp. NPDC047841]|uniref:ABC transporter permease n=1 Tax=Streptomyces sp. NPDC047841 TaxID=3154708 RepID=UPI00345309CD
MTATLSAPAPVTAAPRQIRWLLRLHRPAVYTWALLVVGGAGTLLWLWGPLTDAAATAWHDYDACAPFRPCRYDQDAILRYKDVYQYTTTLILAVPFLTAAWAGAALTGREVEAGMVRLAWTQGVSPVRWLTSRLAVPALLITAGTGLLAMLHHVAWSAGDGRIDTAKRWYDVATFYSGGPLIVALALTGLVIGALAGLLIGRSLVALCASALSVAALWIAVQISLPHLWPTVTGVAGRGKSPTHSGITVEEGIVTATGAHVPASTCASDAAAGCRSLNDQRHAVGFYADYHPYSHYWPLHLVPAALLLALTAVLTTLAFWLVHHRTTGTPTHPKTTPATGAGREG